MKFNVLSATSRSISIELVNEYKFTCEKNLNLYINDELWDSFNNNVYTIYDLEPATDYTIQVESDGEQFEKIVRTKAENELLNVKDFGAVGDGRTNDTMFIQSAINCCPEGGTVLIPEGIYYTQPLFLKSNITIYLQRGAVLLGAKDRSQYPILPKKHNLGSWEGKFEDEYASIINGINVESVNIIGEGEIDGNASFENWWKDAKVKRGAWRPKILYFNNCRNIIVEGIKIKNSPSWTIHPLLSENIKFINLDIKNPVDSPNTDGLNPESCRNVEIVGVRFSVGDDCIAIKAGRGCYDELNFLPCENILIRNCLMEFGHGAVTIGSEMTGGVRNVRVEKCVFNNTDRGLRIKTRRGRGGFVDEICLSDVLMNEVKTPLTVNAFYSCDKQNYSQIVWTKETISVDEYTPKIGSITVKNVRCEKSKTAAAFVYGLPEAKIENLYIEDMYVDFDEEAEEGYAEMLDYIQPMCRNGFYLNNVKTLVLNNVEVKGCIKEPFTIANVDNIEAGVGQDEG